jgi:hypothetical protein
MAYEGLYMFKFVKIIVLIVCMALIFSACSQKPKDITKQEKIRLLEDELTRWNTFKITGMCDIQLSILSGRYNCVITKTEDKFRLDIISGGLFGLGGGTILAIYIDTEQILVRNPGNPQVESKKITPETRTWINIITQNLSQRIMNQKDHIIETQKAEIEGIEIHFTDRMKLKEIKNKTEATTVSFLYDKNNALSEINAVMPLIKKMTLQIDKIEYNNITVQPL